MEEEEHQANAEYPLRIRWIQAANSCLLSVSSLGHDEAFSSSSDAPNTFSDASGVWPQLGAHTARSWNSTDNTASRRASASPSPVHMRDSSQTYHEHLHERTPSATNASYLAARVASSASYATSRPSAAGPSLDSNAAPFRYPAPLSSLRNSVVDVDGEVNATSSYPSFGFDTETRPPQDLSNGFNSTSATVTRSSSSISTSGAAPVPGAANSGIATTMPSLNSFGSMPSSSHNGHAHRPSLQASFSSPAPSTSHQRPLQSEEHMSLMLADLMMRHTMSVVDRQDFGAGLTGAYAATASAPFQYNPTSQTWDTVDPLTTAALAAARGSLAGLDPGVTSAGNSFRQGAGPHVLGASANGTGQWNRPVSRDLRVPGFHDGFDGTIGLLQQPPSQNLTQEQHLQQQHLQQQHLQQLQQQQQQQQQFSGAPGLLPSNIGSFYNTLRTSVVNPQLGLHPLGAPFIPPAHVQVSRDRDPAHAFRSPLLDEYRASRTSRRFELKVRIDT